MRQSKKMAILGAGLLGRALALSFAKDGFDVAVYDKSSSLGEDSAAHVAASMLAPLAESVNTERSIVRMGYYSLERWQTIIDHFPTPVFFQQVGTLVIWHAQDLASSIYFSKQLAAVYKDLPELPRPTACDSIQLEELEPALSKQFSQGLFLPKEGQLDNREVLQALLLESISLGVQYHFDHPVDLRTFPSSHFDQVIDCRGIGGRVDLPELRGVRGEVLRVFAPEVELKRPIRLIHPKYPLYIAPKRNHLFVIGATEIESEDDSPISVRSTLELLSAVYSVHSGFAEARILESSAQCRPTLKNNLPSIRPFGKNILQVNGLYRHGFLITPAVVDATRAIVLHNDFTLAERFDLVQQEAIH